MLTESALYTFLDDQEDYVIHFLEGQKLLADLAVQRPLGAHGLAFTRNLLLSTQLLLALLKRHEGISLTIDSPSPNFLFKIETNFSGHYRMLILPENFDQFPHQINGQLRLMKHSAHSTNAHHYTSILELQESPLNQVVEQLLATSYQVEAKILLGENSDQALLMLKLPRPPKKGSSVHPQPDPLAYLTGHQTQFTNILNQALSLESDVVTAWKQLGLSFLGKRLVTFHCPCSHEQMVHNLQRVLVQDPNLFGQDPSLQLKCDYCQKEYEVTPQECQTSNGQKMDS